ncbi:MAG: cell division protein CrgA [Actinomycetota bacterium]|jgi:polyferredoxin
MRRVEIPFTPYSSLEAVVTKDLDGTHKAKPVKLDSPKWLAPLMIILFVVGLIWIVTFYLAGPSIPLMRDLPNLGNIGVGFAFITAGFFLSTKWK